MDENLVGYLLGALEPEERRQVEAYLRTSHCARERLALLRQALEPLAADEAAPEPEPSLWVRTLSRVAEQTCRPLPRAPHTLRARPSAVPRPGWRRPDALVAAGIVLCVGLLIPPALSQVRYRHNILACQNNLRLFYNALQDYSERHEGHFPNPADESLEPRNVAGMFVPILNQEHLLPEEVSVSCPSQGRQPPSRLSLRDVATMRHEEFGQYVPTLAGCYAYSLGYCDENGQHGLRLDPNQPVNTQMPILADGPPAGVDWGNLGNSPNHAGRGQNVLYIDGHCGFWTNRTVGVNGDDIYVNFDREVKAGKALWDAVLGGSAARP
jgi:hypothetical protein